MLSIQASISIVVPNMPTDLRLKTLLMCQPEDCTSKREIVSSWPVESI